MTTVDEYILSRVSSSELLEVSLLELARLKGHTKETPLSSAIFCLDEGLTLAERDKLFEKLRSLAKGPTVLAESTLKKELGAVVPKVLTLPTAVFYGMVEIFVKEAKLELATLAIDESTQS